MGKDHTFYLEHSTNELPTNKLHILESTYPKQLLASSQVRIRQNTKTQRNPLEQCAQHTHTHTLTHAETKSWCSLSTAREEERGEGRAKVEREERKGVGRIECEAFCISLPPLKFDQIIIRVISCAGASLRPSMSIAAIT